MLRVFRSLPLFSQVCWVMVAFLFCGLVWSAVSSGVHYQYDNDELSQAQYSYLIHSGYVPHHDFFLRYTPIFSWFLLPFFAMFGYQFSTVMLLRWVMVVLFLLRAGVSAVLVHRVFGTRIAVVFLLLFFLDPFTVFAAMQIRPDTVMALVYTFGLLLLLRAYDRRSLPLMASAGALLSLSVLLLLKIIPSVFIICLGVTILSLMYRRYKDLVAFVVGIGMPGIVFFLIMGQQGAFKDMLQQVLIDSATMNRYLLNPTWISYFYTHWHIYIFGPNSPSWLWIFVWLLLISSLTGAVVVIITLVRKKKNLFSWKSWFSLMLAVSFLVQFLSISVFPGAFIQYFVSVGWLMAIFTALSLLFLSDKLRRFRVPTRAINLMAMGLFSLFAIAAIRANLFRATITADAVQATDERIWKIIPEAEASFPNFLFRPLAYPIPYGTFIGDAPPEILARFPSISTMLEQKHVRYVFFDSYSLVYFDQRTKAYLQEKYHATSEPNVYQRNE